MSKNEKRQMLKNVKRKAFGWSNYTNLYNRQVIYEANTIFLDQITQDNQLNLNIVLPKPKKSKQPKPSPVLWQQNYLARQLK